MSEGRARFALGAAIVAVPLGVYVVAGLASGARFPSRADCARPAVAGRPVDVVFGRFDHPAPAEQLRAEVARFGFRDVRLVPDGCGRWEVTVPDREDIPAGRRVQVEASSVNLATRLEEAAP